MARLTLGTDPAVAAINSRFWQQLLQSQTRANVAEAGMESDRNRQRERMLVQAMQGVAKNIQEEMDRKRKAREQEDRYEKIHTQAQIQQLEALDKARAELHETFDPNDPSKVRAAREIDRMRDGILAEPRNWREKPPTPAEIAMSDVVILQGVRNPDGTPMYPHLEDFPPVLWSTSASKPFPLTKKDGESDRDRTLPNFPFVTVSQAEQVRKEVMALVDVDSPEFAEAYRKALFNRNEINKAYLHGEGPPRTADTVDTGQKSPGGELEGMNRRVQELSLKAQQVGLTADEIEELARLVAALRQMQSRIHGASGQPAATPANPQSRY